MVVDRSRMYIRNSLDTNTTNLNIPPADDKPRNRLLPTPANRNIFVEFLQNLTLSDEDNNEIGDDSMSTDSDNEKVPDLDYQEELRSRLYYYASFVYQQDSQKREVDGSENPDDSILTCELFDYEDNQSFNESNEYVLEKEKKSDDKIESNLADDSKLNAEITLYLTLDFSELENDTMLQDISTFNPRKSSTFLHELGKEKEQQHRQEISEIEIENIDETSFCPDQTLLSVIASSSICRDEFSLMDSEIDPEELMPNKKVHILRRVTTVSNLNTFRRQAKTNQTTADEVMKTPAKSQSPLMKVFHHVRKSLTPTKKKSSKQNGTESPNEQPELDSPVNLQDKKTVARKLRRFRDSFRRKDKDHIRTLAML